MGYMKILYEDIWQLHTSDPKMSNARIAEYLDCPMDWVDSALADITEEQLIIRTDEQTIDELSKLIADETLT